MVGCKIVGVDGVSYQLEVYACGFKYKFQNVVTLLHHGISNLHSGNCLSKSTVAGLPAFILVSIFFYAVYVLALLREPLSTLGPQA